MEKKAMGIRRIYLGMLFLMITITVLFNILVDPYRIFLLETSLACQLKRDQYISHVPGDGGASNIMKAAGIIKYKPNTIILGTSVADTGFLVRGSYYTVSNQPQEIENVMPENERPVYNAAIRGGGIGEIYLYLQHALVNNPNLKKVIIGLEPGHFHTPEVLWDNSLINKKGIDLKTFAERTLSYSALKVSFNCSIFGESLEKFARNFQSINPQKPTPSDQFIPVQLNSHDLHYTFIDKNKDRAITFSTATNVAVNIQHIDAEKLEQGFKTLEKIVALAKEKHIKLVFFLNPSSPYTYAILYRTDNTKMLYKIMSRLATITPFYDFDDIITFNDTDKTYPFFPDDALHFTPYVGNKILPIAANLSSRAAKSHLVTKENVRAIFDNKVKCIKKYIDNNPAIKSVLYDTKIDFATITADSAFPILYSNETKNKQILAMFGKYYAIPKDSHYNLINILKNTRGDAIAKSDLDSLISNLA